MIETLVIDASVAIKWLVPEDDFETARALRGKFRLIAPQLIYAECANILWKKVQRGDLSNHEAASLAGLIDALDIEVASMRGLVEAATTLSTRLRHPAYDCFYLALAILEDCRFITADVKFHRRVQEGTVASSTGRCVLLNQFKP